MNLVFLNRYSTHNKYVFKIQKYIKPQTKCCVAFKRKCIVVDIIWKSTTSSVLIRRGISIYKDYFTYSYKSIVTQKSYLPHLKSYCISSFQLCVNHDLTIIRLCLWFYTLLRTVAINRINANVMHAIKICQLSSKTVVPQCC